MLNILDLHDDALSAIFDQCTVDEVLRLYYVCRKFREIIIQNTFLRKSRDLLLVGHRNKQAISYQRTLRDLSYHKRIKLFKNWSQGRYEEYILCHRKFFHPGHIHLERQWLYTTYGGQLRKYRRLKRGILERKQSEWSIGQVRQPDITCFVKKQDLIFAGRRNGYIFMATTGEIGADETDDIIDERVENDAQNNVACVDFHGDLFVTTSRAGTKFWHRAVELEMPYLEPLSIDHGANKCLRISPDGTHCATGKFNDRQRTALRLFDLETLTERTLGSSTTSIYDIVWKNDQLILTGNYDTTFRLFDLRTNADQSIWTDPYDLSVYCIAYDGNYGVLCGMQYHCRVNLYDLRVPNRYIQLYFPNKRPIGTTIDSPAYSVANDQSQLFISTDHNLRVLDFDASWAESKDYTNMFAHEMIVEARA